MASVFLASQEKKIRLRKKVKSHAMCERTRTSKKKKKKKKKTTQKRKYQPMKKGATTRGDSSSSSAPRMGRRLRFRRKKKRKREEEEDSEEEDETTSKNDDEKLEALLENAYRHDRAIKRLNKETEQELRSTIAAYPKDDLTTFAKKYAGDAEDIRQRHAKGVEALRKRLDGKSELSRSKGCVDEHDVDNRARKKAKFDESDDDRNDAKATSDANGSFALAPIPRVPGALR